MNKRPPLTHLGCDIILTHRTVEGRAVFNYVDTRSGKATAKTGRAWPHQLSGHTWLIGTIKAAIAQLPLEGTASKPAPAVGAPRLHAHFAIPEGDR